MKKNNENIELENFVKENVSSFNTENPDEGHFNRFQEKLDKQSKAFFSIKNSMKYAAAIALLISSFFIYNNYYVNSENVIANNTQQEEDFKDISKFYNSQIQKKKYGV